MAQRAIVDTGPLVAFLDRREAHHAWAVDVAATLALPWRTCEAVLAECSHLLRRLPDAQDALLAIVEEGLVSVDFVLTQEITAVRALQNKYRDRPMSLADACLVRLAERFDDHVVCTLDSDFAVYRKNGSEPLSLVYPAQ